MRKEFEWLSRHPEEENRYRGEYIAVVGTRIVAHGKDALQVIKKAKKVSDDPLISKVPRKEVLIV